jgi:hypothetical protein
MALKDWQHCGRCGFACPHVEAAGMWHCPNCGLPIPCGDGVEYPFNQGCQACGLPGHMPMPGYMEPLPEGHPRVVFGLAPAKE